MSPSMSLEVSGRVWKLQRQVSVDGELNVWKGCRRCAAGMRLIEPDSDGCIWEPRDRMRDEAREVGWRAWRQRLAEVRDRVFKKETA